MSVLVISGSPSRLPSRSGALLQHVASRLTAGRVPVEHVAVRDFPTSDLIEVRHDGPAATDLRAAVARAAAIVIAAPVYNASIPGGLKALLDLLPEKALADRFVLPLASGGSAGHQLAIEYSLKPVLSALGARHVLAGVFACDGDVVWRGARGDEPVFDARLAVRLDEAVETLLALLAAPSGARTAARAVLRPVANGFAAERCSA